MRPRTAALLAIAASCLLTLGVFERTSQGATNRIASSSPLAPVHAQVGGAMKVAVEHDGRLWLGVGPRLVALAVDDPAAPVELGRTAVLPDVVEDLAIDSTRPMAWLAVGGWLVGIDLTQPTAPAETGRLLLPGRAEGIALASGQAGLLMDDGRILGVDIADAQQPRLLAEIPDLDRSSCTVDVAGQANHLYRLVIDEAREQPPFIQTIDVSVSSAPVILAPVVLDVFKYLPSCDSPAQLEWAGDTLWARVGGVLAAYKALGNRLLGIGHDTIGGGWAVAMAIEGNRAYVSLASGWSDNYGLASLDISDPNAIRVLIEPKWEIGRYPGVFSRAIAVAGDHLWAASSGGFLTALDRRDGAALRTVGAYSTVGEISSLDLDASRLYALSNQSAQVVDVSLPSDPQHLGLVAAGYHYSAVSADGPLAGLAIWGQSDMLFGMLELVDLRDPRRPVSVFNARPAGGSSTGHRIDMDGNVLAYASTGFGVNDRVTVFDVSNPNSPVSTADLALDGRPAAVTLADGQLFTLVVGRGNIRLLRNIVPGAAPSAAAIPLTSDTSDYPDAFMTLSENHAYILVSDNLKGSTPIQRRLRLFTVDITQPDRLELADASPIPCSPNCRPSAIAYADGQVFVSSSEAVRGVMVVDVTDLTSPRVSQELGRMAPMIF